MDNSMDNMLDMYLFETNSLLEQLDELLINAEKSDDFSTDDVNEIFRIMHTIKGSSAMMQFTSLMTIAHHIEDLFFYIRENGLEALDSSHKTELFNLMFRSTDILRAEVTKLESNEPLSSNVDNFATEINSYLSKISNSGDIPVAGVADTSTDTALASSSIDIIRQDLAGCPDDDSKYFLKMFFEEGCGMENLRAFMLVTSMQEAELSFKFYPEDVETNPETCTSIIEDGFFLSFMDEDSLHTAVSIIKNLNNLHSYEVIENAKKATKEIKTQTIDEISSATDVSTPSIAQANSPVANNPAHGTANKQSLISVNLSKLDSLMALVGEIVITESMVASSPEIQDLKLDSFLKSTRQLRKLTDDLQDIAMSLRMVPVSGVFQKMNRIVRDMKQKLGKDVRLTIVGENTEVDKSIVDNIGDPIMHIVRNSMDHGLENTAEERIAAGKDPQGEITLSASHTGSEVIISVSDDGRGMDSVAILAKAKASGILTKPESEYSQKEILALLMVPGFSTNETVTEFSGRGVGMDVVKRNVEAVGGIVTITSEEGKGSRTTLKIPLTLAIVDGMEISVGSSLFTIPISNIRQSFKVEPGDVIFDSEGNEIIKCMDEFFPIVRIHERFNIEPKHSNIEDGILVWVESSDKSYCLFVDELLGEQQVVVKPLPVFLNSFNIKDSGISGCTILGDGNISIILDILNLYTV
ncbi:MAG: chemotaxis protein CheA [Lachnospiraceae bacterium]